MYLYGLLLLPRPPGLINSLAAVLDLSVSIRITLALCPKRVLLSEERSINSKKRKNLEIDETNHYIVRSQLILENELAPPLSLRTK